ncbi:hypothetical protein J6590_018867 [Homalodisca vitripennis]|nr:hypothetical protein J6590_018867 [Homalodisca vitripennis]
MSGQKHSQNGICHVRLYNKNRQLSRQAGTWVPGRVGGYITCVNIYGPQIDGRSVPNMGRARRQQEGVDQGHSAELPTSERVLLSAALSVSHNICGTQIDGRSVPNMDRGRRQQEGVDQGHSAELPTSERVLLSAVQSASHNICGTQIDGRSVPNMDRAMRQQEGVDQGHSAELPTSERVLLSAVLSASHNICGPQIDGRSVPNMGRARRQQEGVDQGHSVTLPHTTPYSRQNCQRPSVCCVRITQHLRASDRWPEVPNMESKAAAGGRNQGHSVTLPHTTPYSRQNCQRPSVCCCYPAVLSVSELTS